MRLEIFLLYSAVVTDFFVCWGLFLCSPVKNVKTFHISSIFGTDCKHAFLHSAKKKTPGEKAAAADFSAGYTSGRIYQHMSP